MSVARYSGTDLNPSPFAKPLNQCLQFYPDILRTLRHRFGQGVGQPWQHRLQAFAELFRLFSRQAVCSLFDFFQALAQLVDHVPDRFDVGSPVTGEVGATGAQDVEVRTPVGRQQVVK